MTQLRKMMLEELERRNYSQSTVRTYVKTIADLARYFKRRPDQLGPDQLRQYQAYLFRERKLAANTVNQRTAALRFFFVTTLKKPWTIAETPYPRRTFQLPKVLSVEQVSKLVDAAPRFAQHRRTNSAHLAPSKLRSEPSDQKFVLLTVQSNLLPRKPHLSGSVSAAKQRLERKADSLAGYPRDCMITQPNER